MAVDTSLLIHWSSESPCLMLRDRRDDPTKKYDYKSSRKSQDYRYQGEYTWASVFTCKKIEENAPTLRVTKRVLTSYHERQKFSFDRNTNLFWRRYLPCMRSPCEVSKNSANRKLMISVQENLMLKDWHKNIKSQDSNLFRSRIQKYSHEIINDIARLAHMCIPTRLETV